MHWLYRWWNKLIIISIVKLQRLSVALHYITMLTCNLLERTLIKNFDIKDDRGGYWTFKSSSAMVVQHCDNWTFLYFYITLRLQFKI